MKSELHLNWPLRVTAVIVAVIQSLIGWPLVVMGVLVTNAPVAKAEEFVSDSERIGAQEYPANVEPRQGADEGIRNIEIDLPENPTDVDITSARIFAEPLIPFGESVEGENAALGQALMAFANRKNKEDVSMLDSFLAGYPNSRWKVGLQTNIALLLRKSGYFTDALRRFEQAWEAGKEATGVEQRALADRALGELADLNARFGRYEKMKQLFDQAQGRDIAGSSQTLLRRAQEGYWMMTKKTAEGFRCGPYAVNAVLDAGKKYVPNPEIAKEASSLKGTNLLQLRNLSSRVGLDYQMARKQPGTPWAVPMVVHWKVGHFAAITRKEKGRYLVKDPTFGGEIWVTSKALDSEATGYGLIAAHNGALPEGWAAVSDDEGASVWGKGGAESKDPNATGQGNEKCKDCPPKRMAQYDMFKMLATLQLSDTPVGYTPPFGIPIEFKVTYNHLEAGQPANFNFTNFGASWVSNWLSYLEVDGGGNVAVHLRDGGGEVFEYSGFDPISGKFQPSIYSAATLIRKSAVKYEREMPDGSREVYSQVDGATGRIFLKEIIDAQGNKVTLNYDADLRLTSIVDGLNQSTAITYKSNSSGNVGFYKVDRVTDPFNRYAEFTYDSATTTKLIKIKDVIGIESSFTYADNGFITKLNTPYGDTNFYQYVPAEDGTGQGLLVILPDGSKECIESYRGHDMMTYFWDRKAMAMAPGDRTKAEQTHWLLSEEGQVMMDLPQWRKKALEGSANETPITVDGFEYQKGTVYYSYPAQPDPTESADPDDPPGTLHNFVGALNKPAVIKRLLEGGTVQKFQYEYNGLGQIKKYIDPVGRTYSFLYAANDLDLLEVRQTRNGNNDLLGKWTYDTRHLPKTFTDASGQKTSASYNGKGQLTTVTNAKSETTTFTYTGNYLTRVDGPLSGTNDRADATYDSYGRLRTVTLNQGPTSADQWMLTIDYDALDRVTKLTYPDGTTDENSYSRLDLVRSKDRLNRWTQYVYTSLGQISKMRDPAGTLTQYEWCRCGALQKLTDGLGRVTQWTYDVQGRLVKKTYADTSHQDYQYDPSISRIASVTDPAGNVTSYTYYLDNTIAGIASAPVSGFADVPDMSVTWDADYRRIATAGDSYGTYTFNYNPFVQNAYGSPVTGNGRLQSVATSALAGATVAYEYDELGRINKRQVNGSANESAWSYDAAGRLSSWSNLLGTFTPTYQNSAYGVDRLSSVAFPNGQIVNYQWENKAGDFRLKEIENLGASSAPLSKFGYVTDAMARITQWTQQSGSATPARYDLGYNRISELTSAVLVDTGTSGTLKQYYYSYDAAGNRKSEQIDNTVTGATFNNLNQLTDVDYGGQMRFKGSLNEPGTVTVAGQPAWMSGATNFTADVFMSSGTSSVPVVARDANNNSRTNNYQVNVPTGGSVSCSYDANGNMLADGTNTYDWDAKNRLIKSSYASGSTEYSYDCFGRRVKIVEKDGGGSVTSTKQFVFSGINAVEQRDSGNAVTKRYFEDGWRDVVGSENCFFTKDHLGSVREVTNGSGLQVAQYDYDPFGRTSKVSGTVDSDFLYTGHYYDPSSALYLTAYRAYVPKMARWLSRDPLANAEMIQGPNLYTYVANNPIYYTDPLGLDKMNLLNPNRQPSPSNPNPRQTWENVNRSNLYPDDFTVAAHGDPGVLYDSNDNRISPEKLADMIKNDPNYTPGQQVRLMACYAGAPGPNLPSGGGGESYAERLEKALNNGSKVIGPTDILTRIPSEPTTATQWGTPERDVIQNGGYWK